MAFLIVAAPLARAAAKCCAEGAGAVALGGGAADGSGGAADEGSYFFSTLTGGGVSGGKPKKNLADYGAVGEDDLDDGALAPPAAEGVDATTVAWSRAAWLALFRAAENRAGLSARASASTHAGRGVAKKGKLTVEALSGAIEVSARE